MKTIALIEPKAPGYHIFSHFFLPRLGLPILAAIMKQQGYRPSLYYQELGPLNYKEIGAADYIGISTTTSTSIEAYNIADKLKAFGKPIIMGGSHVTYRQEEALEHCHYVVCGEGEISFPQLIECLDKGQDFTGVPGLSYRDAKEPSLIHNTPLGPKIADLDSLPLPDFSSIKGGERLKITPIQTSRGCPYDCSFCSVTQLFGRKYRTRSIDSVIDELAQNRRGSVFFYDDNFAANANRTKELLETMLRRGITPRWSAQVRAEISKDKELMELMRRTNCFALDIGFESINPRSLEIYNKKLNLGEIKDSIKTLRRNGFHIHGMFVLGSDEDEACTIKETASFAICMKINTVQFMMLTPLPGSALYQQMEKDDRILTKDWSLYDGHHVVYKPKKMSPWVLETETVKAMKRFYSRWQYIKPMLAMHWRTGVFRRVGHRVVKKWDEQRRRAPQSLKDFKQFLGSPNPAAQAKAGTAQPSH